jgi:hypothetical protein
MEIGTTAECMNRDKRVNKLYERFVAEATK